MGAETRIFLVIAGGVSLFGAMFIYAMINLAPVLASKEEAEETKNDQSIRWIYRFFFLIGLGCFIGAIFIP